MSGYIEITENKKINNRNVISFKCSRNLENFFNTLEYYTDYEFNIGDIPDSILNISFICNILPILWLTNYKLIVKSIDKDFFESVEKIKSGYEKMYPNIEFYKTKIEFQHIEKNIINHTEKYGMFFSGGIDAYSMLFEHIEENPLLITVWGADIETYNEKGWNCTKNNIEVTSKMFYLENQYIKSNFKEFLNTSELNKLIVKSNDKWWHGFQHGIGLIGLAATIAYKEKLKKIYIASSYPIEANVTCASHPTIDNNVSFCGIQVIHDQAELNRQEKIQLIVDYTSTTNKFHNIHLCCKYTSGENCCVC